MTWTRELAEFALADYVDGVHKEVKALKPEDFTRDRVANILNAYYAEYCKVHMVEYQSARRAQRAKTSNRS